MSIDFTEFAKVVIYLVENDISCELRPFYGGYLCCVPTYESRDFDFICHSTSYGHEEGLLEIMGAIVTDEESEIDSVVGWLTADNVIERIKKHLISKENS